MNEGFNAMVLAAGLGTRLWPLTLDRAKPAIPFLNRPLLSHVLDWLEHHGANDAVVNTSYRADTVEAAARMSSLTVSLSPEEHLLGTAGALGLARDRGLLRADSTTVIVNGKLYLELDLAAALRAHTETQAAITMILRANVSREHFREVLAQNGVVTGFGEGRIPQGPDPLAFTGIHIVAPEVLADMQAVLSDTVRDIYPRYLQQGRIHAHIDNGRWWELSTPERYLGLHQQAWQLGLAARPPGGNVLWPHAAIHPEAQVQDSVLGEGVVLPAKARLNNVVVVKKSLLDPSVSPPRPGYALQTCWVTPLNPSSA